MSSRPFQRFGWQRSTVTAECTSLSFPRAAPFSTTDAFSPFFRKSVIFSDSFSEQDTATGTRAATDIHVERGAGRHFSPQIWRFARNAADLSRFSAVQKDSGAFGKRFPGNPPFPACLRPGAHAPHARAGHTGVSGSTGYGAWGRRRNRPAPHTGTEGCKNSPARGAGGGFRMQRSRHARRRQHHQ